MNDKPRMVEVTDPVELGALRAARNDINAPYLVMEKGKFYSPADELRAWRAGKQFAGEEDVQ